MTELHLNTRIFATAF